MTKILRIFLKVAGISLAIFVLALNSASAIGTAFIPDFTISVSPSSRSVNQGGSAQFTVSVNPINGFGSPVSLALSLPNSSSPLSGNFSPQIINPGQTSTLTVNVNNTAASGYYDAVVRASSGSKVKDGLIQISVSSVAGNPPSVTSGSATNITTTSATISGSVNSNGYNATYWFEYGTSASLGNSTPHQSVGSSSNLQNVSSNISNLAKNTTHYFKMVAQNQWGTSRGALSSFVTHGDVGGVLHPASKPTATFWSSKDVVSKGEVFSLSWTSSDASECHKLAGAGFDTNGLTSGTDNNVTLAVTTTYALVCTGPGGSVELHKTVSLGGSIPQGSAPSVQTNSATNLSQSSATLNSTINPNGASTSYWFEYGTSQSLGNTTASQSAGSGTFNRNLSGSVYGLNSNTTYYFRAVAQNAYGIARGNMLSFSTNGGGGGGGGGNTPSAQTNSANNVGQNSATLNGSINPNGASTSYWFEYGVSQSLGNMTSSQNAGSGTSANNSSASITGLSANVAYYFRIVAQNSFGTTYGSILSFTTNSGGGGGGSNVPVVQTGGASNANTNSATVSGTVDSNGLSAVYWFEYGTTQSLGNTTAFQSAGSGNDANPYTTTLSGLSSNVIYYYRIIGQNSAGTSYGSILSFTTGSGGGGGGNCTAPFVSTSGANNAYQGSATLNGSVNPNNCATSYWFEYGINYWMGNTTGSQSAGGSNGQFNATANISGLSANATYYYRIVGQNAGGTSYGNILNFQTSGNSGCLYGNCNNNNGYIPSVQTNSSNVSGGSVTFYGQVNPNNSDTNAWFVYGTDYSNLYQTTNSQYIGAGSSQQYYNQTVYNLNSGTVYYYQAVARNNYGMSFGQILNTSGGGGNYWGNASAAVTNPATYVYTTSALLNGQINPNGSLTNGWFEYGPTNSLGLRTASQPMGSNNAYSNISFALVGLSPNTTYYFRTVAQSNNGNNSYGSILSFTTTGGGVVVTPPQPPVVITTNVGNGSGLSCLMLVPALNVSELQPREQFTFTVTYRNGCTYNLSNVYLKVILPPGTEFISTNYPFFNRDTNGISYNLGALPSDSQSSISIQGAVGSSINSGSTLIFSSVLNFNDSRGRFQSLSAYLTAIVGQGKTLGATVIGTLGSLLSNWIFDLLLILAVAFLIYWLFLRKDENGKEEEEDILEAKPFSTNK